jgi:hypothetical protein
MAAQGYLLTLAAYSESPSHLVTGNTSFLPLPFSGPLNDSKELRISA